MKKPEEVWICAFLDRDVKKEPCGKDVVCEFAEKCPFRDGKGMFNKDGKVRE